MNTERRAFDEITSVFANATRVAPVGPAGDVAAAAAARIVAARPGDVVLTLGAGDGDGVGMALLEALARPSEVGQSAQSA